MLAARLYGPMDLRVEEVPRPVINDDEILLKIECAAICGTDVRMYKNGYPGVDQDHPRTLGHEFGGTIEEIGKNVKGFSPGMRVALAPNIGCGICDRCVRGDVHLCEHYQAFGVTMDGAFAEYVKVPANAIRQGNLTVIPEGVDAEEVAINEPLSCAYNGFLKCNIRPGDSVLIVGAGPIGIMHAKLALMAGAAKVFMNDLSQERLEESRAIEPRIISYHGDDLKGFIMAQTGGNGLNVAITACPAPAVQAAMIDLMDIGGRVLFFGGLPKGKEIVPLNTNMIHYKELIVTGSTRANNEHFRKTLGFIADGILDVKNLVTARFSIKEMDKAMDNAIQAKGLKNIITF
jgi:L-iditol 2-dehydrogenase